MDTEVRGDQENGHGVIYRHSEIIPGIGVSALWLGMVVPVLLSAIHPVAKTAIFLGAVWGLNYMRVRLKSFTVTHDGILIHYPLRPLEVFIGLNDIELLVLAEGATKYSPTYSFTVFTRGNRKEGFACPSYHSAEQVIRSFTVGGVKCLNLIKADSALLKKVDDGRHIPEALKRYKNM
jgi:hypothetical protein